MRVITPYHEILALPGTEDLLGLLEQAGRTCYKSEDKISAGSARDFVSRILKSGHESVIEHISCTVRFVCDRGVSHELVRHRLASYSQESTRYANYAKDRFGSEITVIKPCFWQEDSREYQTWLEAMQAAEQYYMQLINAGARAQEARSVLPNSLKTEIIMTCNLREWRHVFNLRCSKPAHPQIRQITLALLEEIHERVPVLYEDIYTKYKQDIQDYKTTGQVR